MKIARNYEEWGDHANAQHYYARANDLRLGRIHKRMERYTKK